MWSQKCKQEFYKEFSSAISNSNSKKNVLDELKYIFEILNVKSTILKWKAVGFLESYTSHQYFLQYILYIELLFTTNDIFKAYYLKLFMAKRKHKLCFFHIIPLKVNFVTEIFSC